MPIVAGLIPKGILAAVTAMKGLASEFRRAAIDQPVQHALLVRGEPAGIVFDRPLGIASEEVIDCGCVWLGGRDAWDLPVRRRLLVGNDRYPSHINVKIIGHEVIFGDQAKPLEHGAC